MWFALVENLLRRSMFYENPQYLPVSSFWILYQCIQLSIRKSPCTALSKLDICTDIKNSCLPECLYRFTALFRRRSLLDQNRTVSVLGKQIGTK